MFCARSDSTELFPVSVQGRTSIKCNDHDDDRESGREVDPADHDERRGYSQLRRHSKQAEGSTNP